MVNIKFVSAVSLILLLLFGACQKFEYSPYQVKDSGSSDSLNAVNLRKLMAAEPLGDDTVTVLFSGDCQRFYDELEPLVDKVNGNPGIDFLIMDGDISDFGLLKEFEWIYARLNKLHVPYLCAIGNHDLTSRGGEVYTSVFGEKNYSFKYKGYKFLFHNTNGREYNFNGSAPNMWWLSDQLKDSTASWFVGVSHVPPYDADFDNTLEMPYKNLFSQTPNLIASLHGHVGSFYDGHYYKDHVRYIQGNTVDKREAVLLKMINGTILLQKIPY